MDHGRTFDGGYPAENLAPQIDLDPLVEKCTKSISALDETIDRDSVLLLPSSKEVSNVVSSAFGALSLLESSFHARDFTSLAQILGKRWCGHMLRRNCIFELHGKYVLSLGFHGYSAMGYSMKHFHLPDGSHGFYLHVP